MQWTLLQEFIFPVFCFTYFQKINGSLAHFVFFWFRDFVCMLIVSLSIYTGQSIPCLWVFGWWAEGGNTSSFVWITVGAEKLSFHWFDQPRLAKNLSMGQQLTLLVTMLFCHRSFLVKSVKIDQRGEFARSVGNRGVTWVITQRDLSLWATSLLLNKSDKVKQMWLQIFCFVLNNTKTHAKQKVWNSFTKKRS